MVLDMNKELLQQLAIAALTGLSQRQDYAENIARDAVRLAKATLKELEKEDKLNDPNI